MSRALLDINVLLALLDSDHIEHQRAHAWLDGEISAGWASCAITQNGFVRVISQARYPSPIPPKQAIDLLGQACAEPHHVYWPCDLSICDEQAIDRTRLHGPRQVTDAYLLALAASQGGRFVTFDQTIAISAARGAAASNLITL